MTARDALLAPLAALYGTGVELRLALYRHGLLRVRRAARPVISIGNVAAGGTGKTPFVRWLARELLRRGLVPSVLTRGYRRQSRGTLVVSDGAGPLAPVAASGDEASLLARALPKVPVVADSRRSRAAELVEARGWNVSLHLLDDGFSHVALARDVDVVLLDATAPDAGGALLPRGLLREPLSSLARADVVVVTKTEQADPGRAVALAHRHAPGVPVYHARTVVTGLSDASGQPVPRASLGDAPLVAVAGIARPGAFSATLSALRLSPAATLAFRDHVRYGPVELGRIEKAVEETAAAAVVTTEKDAVKLAGRLGTRIVSVDIEARVAETGFVGDLLARLARPPS